ncbi:MAG TPA: hypothetical protein VIX19_00875 [Terriglobales bacterium]
MPPRRPHLYGHNHLHYLTANVDRRARLFDSDRFKLSFVQTLGDLQRGGYDMNIWSEKKRLEKLTYMHHNPVKRGLVSQPGDWPWSSWHFYYREDSSILPMDPMA